MKAEGAQGGGIELGRGCGEGAGNGMDWRVGKHLNLR